MGKRSKVISEQVLESLMAGSFEKRMQVLQREIRTKMGNGIAMVASFPGRVMLAEGDSFFTVDYEIGKDGSVELSEERKPLKVPILDEDSVSSGIIDRFLEGGLLEGLDDLVLRALNEGTSPVDAMQSKIDKMFSPRDWSAYVKENRDHMTGPAFDPRLGKLAYKGMLSLFTGLNESNAESERVNVVEALQSIGAKVLELFESADLAFNEYKASVGGFGKQEADLELTETFSDFSLDCLSHLQSVGGFISESLKSVEDGSCVLCGAMAHDAVASVAQEFELGSRLIRRVSLEFARNKGVQEDDK